MAIRVSLGRHETANYIASWHAAHTGMSSAGQEGRHGRSRMAVGGTLMGDLDGRARLDCVPPEAFWPAL